MWEFISDILLMEVADWIMKRLPKPVRIGCWVIVIGIVLTIVCLAWIR